MQTKDMEIHTPASNCIALLLLEPISEAPLFHDVRGATACRDQTPRVRNGGTVSQKFPVRTANVWRIITSSEAYFVISRGCQLRNG